MQDYDYQFFAPGRSAGNLILFIAVFSIAAIVGLIIPVVSNHPA